MEKLLHRFEECVNKSNASSSKDYKILNSVGAIEYDKETHHSIADMVAEADAKMYSHKKR